LTTDIALEIDADRAQAIRAEMNAFIDTELAAGEPALHNDIVVDEILTRHPDLSRAYAEHIAARIMAHGDMPGLDYDEAPKAIGVGADLRAWYPINRGDRIERVRLEELTEAEFGEVAEALDAQTAWAETQREGLRRLAALRRSKP
jgi:hypothetical protein